ncbi:MAG: tetratricopeptide repeat protein [Magnetovibrionaceae bacterium]
MTEAGTVLARAAQAFQQGELTEADSLLDDLLRETPDLAEAHHLRGLVRHAAGDAKTARLLLGRAAQLKPRDPDILTNLGTIALAAGDMAVSGEALKRARLLRPEDPRVLGPLAFWCWQAGDRTAAEGLYRQALQAAPGDPALMSGLGGLLVAQQRADEALSVLNRALDQDPGFQEARRNLALALIQLGRGREALTEAETLVAQKPESGEIQGLAAEAHMALNDPERALHHQVQAVELQPWLTAPRVRLGECLQAAGRLGEAMRLWEDVLRIEPDNADALYNRGMGRFALGLADEALSDLERAAALKPEQTALLDTFISCQLYAQDCGPEERLRPRTRRAEPLNAATPDRPPMRELEEGNRFTIGFLSSGFREYAHMSLFLGPLQAWDQTRTDIVLFSTTPKPDGWTPVFERHATRFFDLAGMSLEARAETVRAAGIDVLVEMDGHVRGNSLDLLARRPAPVQAVWMDAVSTTCLDAVDAFIGDAIQSPEADDGLYSERVIRLGGDHTCFRPPAYGPDHTPLLPSRGSLLSGGPLTFGCFSASFKLSPRCLEAFAEILNTLPDSRLVLNSPGFDQRDIARAFLDRLAALGLSEDRITLIPGAGHHAFIGAYDQIDVALDSTPYSAGVTACEALWMGVPVIAWKGRRFVSRHAASHLYHAGLAEWIAEDKADFVAKAVALGRDKDTLAEARKGLRERFVASPVCDSAGFARDFDTKLRALYRQISASGSG